MVDVKDFFYFAILLKGHSSEENHIMEASKNGH